MFTRRILGAFLASFVGAAGFSRGLSAREAVDAQIMADFPGALLNRAQFTHWQKWFRDHPNLLWSSADRTRTQLVAERAQQLAQPFMAANQQRNTIFDLEAWVDNTTDNVLLKSYKRSGMDKPIGHRGPEVSLGYAITRKAFRDLRDAEMDDHINEAWTAIVAATNQYPVPSGFIKTEGAERVIATLGELKLGLAGGQSLSLIG